MQLAPHTADDFVGALRALLPPGEAWDWPEGGTGHALLLDTAQEPARIEAFVQSVLDGAVEAHRVAAGSWRLVDYQRVADASVVPAPAKTVGLSSPRPLVAGFKTGAKVWGPRARYVLLVNFSSATVDA